MNHHIMSRTRIKFGEKKELYAHEFYDNVYNVYFTERSTIMPSHDKNFMHGVYSKHYTPCKYKNRTRIKIYCPEVIEELSISQEKSVR